MRGLATSLLAAPPARAAKVVGFGQEGAEGTSGRLECLQLIDAIAAPARRRFPSPNH